jgi:hypothetical protein
MTAVISRERAARTGLTAAAGALMLALAFVMMVVAAPGHGHIRVQPAKPSAVRLVTDVRDVTGREPRTFRPWAQAHAGAFRPAGRAAPGPNGARP